MQPPIKETYIAWIWAEPWGDARLCECDCRHSFIHGIYLDGFIRSRGIWKVFTDARVLKSLQLTVTTSFAAALINAGFGVLIAWVLARYTFHGKKILDALIDLPFALPTAVAGIALTTLYSPNGWIGQFLHIKVAYTPIGIILALIFIGIPFVIRTVQPVIEGLQQEVEEAAAILGATRRQTFFTYCCRPCFLR